MLASLKLSHRRPPEDGRQYCGLAGALDLVGERWTLITISLATTVFPDGVGGLSDTAYLVMGLVTALLFFASLLLHELGHALEARREGIATRGITPPRGYRRPSRSR